LREGTIAAILDVVRQLDIFTKKYMAVDVNHFLVHKIGHLDEAALARSVENATNEAPARLLGAH
jgi:hypothetical protein